MKLNRLNEKCMARTVAGTRCNNGGPQRHADAFGRYAICGQHANMLTEGKDVTFVTRITPEIVSEAVNQPRLPGLDQNVSIARESLLGASEGIVVEVFYVRGIEPGKVAVLVRSEITLPRWSKGLALTEAINNMPTIEGRITGIMVRCGERKAVWNRKPNGWVERKVPAGLIMIFKK